MKNKNGQGDSVKWRYVDVIDFGPKNHVIRDVMFRLSSRILVSLDKQ